MPAPSGLNMLSNPFKLCPGSALITPKRLTFTRESNQVRRNPSGNKREAYVPPSPAEIRLITRNKCLKAKRAGIILKGTAQIQLTKGKF
ncbi:hypothetical protein ONS95_013805 [Cadophora gregata]|uniref:uncharacterized protein n=1 Tax=Cadophora gregata TaxID=51156 RepID=UPI0026DB7D79|nr:uncharacterized protein ONS95_013805 [Cadophora gregata]KAK0114311.1 hypothetical protein ONS95_013805 [Cadophora gregata]